MADKTTCPACESHTSSIHRAFAGGDPCPYCGLPALAAAEIEVAMARGADQRLADRAAQAEQRAAEAEDELRKLRDRMRRIRSIVGEDTDRG